MHEHWDVFYSTPSRYMYAVLQEGREKKIEWPRYNGGGMWDY